MTNNVTKLADSDELLTIADVRKDLRVSRSTFYEWRAKGRGPHCLKLPNGEIRIRRSDYKSWLESLEDAA